MKRMHRVVALLIISALMAVIVAMAGAPSAFGDAKAAAVKGIADAHAGKAVAEAGGSLD